MNRLPFTKYASKALNEGREIAGYLGFKDVSSIFVLLGLYGANISWKMDYNIACKWIILDSSAAEHSAVNRRVVGSNPTRGV